MWFAFNAADELETNPQLTQVPVVPLTPPELSALFQLKVYPITFGKLRSPSWCCLLSKSQTVRQSKPLFHNNNFYEQKSLCL